MGKTIISGGAVMTIPVVGTPLSELAVGSTLSLNVNGVAKEFLVVHQGKPSSIYDDSCDGVWLLMKDAYEAKAWHSSNVNDYENSTMHSYLNSTLLGMFDSDIQSVVKQVKIPYRKGSGTDKTATSGSSGLSAKIFLLSSGEVGITGNETDGSAKYSAIIGACLSYFSGCSYPDSKRIAYSGTSAINWWLRSPFCGDGLGANNASAVSTTGALTYSTCSWTAGWIRPALILPATAKAQADGTIKI